MKIINHLKENLLLYICLLIVLAVFLFLLFYKPKTNNTKSDTSSFYQVNINDVIKMFYSTKKEIVYIGRETCKACQEFNSILDVVSINNNIQINYLDLDTVDKENQEPINDLTRKLDLEYTLGDETKPLGEFLGTTPMLIFIKDKKVVYANIGVISIEKVEENLKRYQII